ncbi:MAG: hypothetical protein ACE5OR_17385, partial [bacterium]
MASGKSKNVIISNRGDFSHHGGNAVIMRRYEFTLIVAIVVMFCFSDFSLAINRISLSQVQASFVGENEGEVLGYSVSLIGDVNGDDYDDILIGARESDYSASVAGQVYLIFGRSDGWQMRTPVSEADASFVGESEYDGASFSIVGDIDGDGYDDILIGAATMSWRDKEFVGQTYLIFGQPNGWQMRTPLSEADASFIGIIEGSASGEPVSAGDINGDGYDDILIGAPADFFGLDNP